MTSGSFNGVNYSLRPSKTIQRGLVFDGLRRLQESLDWRKATYLGFGSIWFTDFVLAHRLLRIDRMVSIECHPVGFRRARFNQPYKFIRVKEGLSLDVIPDLYNEVWFPSHPSIAWLDYDEGLDDNKIDEMRFMVENARPGSVLLVTFDASEKHYGDDSDKRREALVELFGRAVPARLPRASLRQIGFAQTLARLTQGLMEGTSTRMRKENGCQPAFRLVYRDKATMVTVGAVFPAPKDRSSVGRQLRAQDWPGFVDQAIEAPHLTSKEAAVLQANLPKRGGMTRDAVRGLGFDLEEAQIEAFESYYRYYPTFAQVVS